MSKCRSTRRVRKHRLEYAMKKSLDPNLDDSLDFLFESMNVPSHDFCTTENQERPSSDSDNLFNNFNISHDLHEDDDLNVSVSCSDSDNELSSNKDGFVDCEDFAADEWDGFFDHEEFADVNHENDESGVDDEDARYDGELIDEVPEVNELRVWAVESRCPAIHLDKLLKILKRRLIPQIPQSSKTLLFTSAAQYKVDTILDADGLQAEFSYLGIEKGLQACVNPALHEDNIIELDFNIDGAKIKKSSPKTMWPILCKVNYNPLPKIYRPFAVLVFYGNGKPKNNIEFFKPFVREVNNLLLNGVSIKSHEFKIVIRSFICDTPARAQVKGNKGPASFNGCERCDVVAHRIVGVTVYTEYGQKRTNDDFRAFSDINHHNEASPLFAIVPEINFIDQFILDSMHLLYLGVMLRLFENWMTGDLNVKLSATQKSELNRRTTKLKADIPREFARKMRSTNYYDKYKAVEHRFFVLYCGPIVLKKLLNQNLYNHFLLFHVACRMLSSKRAVSFIRVSRDYLTKFVEDAIELYGPKFVSLNIHNLSHLADDVENMQCNLSDISAFPYESELGKIKNILLSPNRTIAQYCRRIHEEREILNQVASLPEELVILKKSKEKIICLNYKQQFFSTKHPDNSVLLENGDFVKILEMISRENTIFLKVKKFRIKKSVYTHPCESSVLDMWELETGTAHHNLEIVQLAKVLCKSIKISVNYSPEDRVRSFVVPLLH